MTRLLLLTTMWLAAALGICAQVVTTQPAVVQTDSRDIVITFHADRGNKGLMGLTAADKVYAHTGVITSSSTSGSDWQYAPSWGDNSAKYEMTWVAANTWTLTIPDIYTYYGITNPAVVVKRLAFVFRNANNSKEGKTESNGDIFVDVLEAGFQMQLSSSSSGAITNSNPVTFTLNTSAPADLTIYLDSKDNVLATASGAMTLEATHSFTEAGSFTVYAEAVHNGTTDTESVSVLRIGSSAEVPYPGGTPRMGTVANPDGSVTFCLAAPRKSSVVLVGSWNGYQLGAGSEMNVHTVEGTPYFWTTVDGLADGKDYIYYYLIDGVTPVGDPFANLVLDPWNDQWISPEVFPDMPAYPSSVVQGTPVAVYNSTLNDYNWEVTDFQGVDPDNLIIYELLFRDFTGTEGKSEGNGTVNLAIEKLDYLKDLGVNAIELLPIMEFSGNLSWGYNTNFYMAPDKAYGTPADYRRFIDEAHKRGMAVILDIVFNQSDGLHPWYMMYNIADNPFYNGTAPHAYSVLNDWNQDNPLVQQQWKDALAFWMREYKADGFRFDLVKGLGNNNSYGATYDAANNTWNNVTDANTNRYNATRVARMKELHDAMRLVNPKAYFINENLAGAQEENEMAEDGELNWANINYSACQFAMGWESDAALNRFYAPDDSRTWGSTVSYAESHDEERMAYKQMMYGAAGVKANIPVMMRRLSSVAAQMLMCPGAHMIWQFQELGADQTTKTSTGNNTDNKKVVWSYLDNPNRKGLMESYAQLCKVRADYPGMFAKDASTTVNLSSWTGRTLSLVNGDKALYLVVNPNVSTQMNVSAPVDLSSDDYTLLSCSYDTTPEASISGVRLAAGAYALYGSKALTSGIADVETSASTMVYGVEGAIVVEGDSGARAFNLAGVEVPLSGLQPGVYIVLTADGATKVTVR